MALLYDVMILLHEAMEPLISLQNKSQELLNLLKVENKEVDQLEEWATKYLDILQQ